ncbi:MAG: hypothetical protein ACJ789_14220 [Thermomicrobiales bacterium]
MTDSLRDYGEGREPIPAVNEPTVIFMINKSLRKDSWTDEDVYHATRCAWVIRENARDRAVYALDASHGVVRGAYRIDRWLPAGEKRWCFDGRPAPEIDVVGKSTARIKSRRGNSSPVRFFRDGIAAPAPRDQ